MIRVLVAEDSATVREHLVALLEGDGMTVVGTAGDGAEAVALAERLRPDVVVLDIHMPRMDGYDAARRIMERAPTRIVMATASSNRSDTRTAFDALECGALVLVGKPVGPGDSVPGRELVRTVRLMAEVKVIRRWPARTPPSRPVPRRRAPRVIALGASTGGPAVLSELLRVFPRPLGCPVVLVQHIAPGFTDAFAEWLGSATRRTVGLARHGETLRPDVVYVAPPGRHMGIAGTGRVVLSPRGSNGYGFCPSASHLFGSVADSYGATGAGIVLTGMGRDGAEGLCRLRRAGGLTIAQDESSSVVFGMPAAAIQAGAAELVLPPERIAATIRALMTEAA